MDRRSISQAQTAGEFLSVLMRAKGPRGMSYSELGRLAGMKSRSHPREVVLGKKRLSLENAKKVCRALKLPPDLSDFFLLLVERDLAGGPTNQPVLDRDVEKTRDRLLRRSQASGRNAREFFTLSDATLVYASLGTSGGGVDKTELARKTKLGPARLGRILEHLLRLNFICERENRFYPTDRHLSFADIKAGGSFQRYYLSRIAQLRQRAADGFNSDTELFWEGTLSVKLAELPRLKEELRQLLIRYAEGAEVAEGEALRSITVGFFDPR